VYHARDLESSQRSLVRAAPLSMKFLRVLFVKAFLTALGDVPCLLSCNIYVRTCTEITGTHHSRDDFFSLSGDHGLCDTTHGSPLTGSASLYWWFSSYTRALCMHWLRRPSIAKPVNRIKGSFQRLRLAWTHLRRFGMLLV
jgi:hypothetical protein